MILNASFEVIGETLMPENTYFMEMFFVEKEGLYLSTNHAENPDFTEDYLTFDIFELVPDED